MQFMLLMIPKGYETAKPGTVPTDVERVTEMMKFNQALKDAGVLVTLNGLHPVSAGARVSFARGKPTVVDGPFIETKEVLGGYWVIRVRSKEEAIEWAKRCPGTDNETIEIRQVQELEDFPARVVQHEFDHLNGVLFFDRMKSFETLSFLEEYSRFWQKDDE